LGQLHGGLRRPGGRLLPGSPERVRPGNLLEQPADAVWNGERIVQLRRALVQKRPEDIRICKACDVPWHGSYSGRTRLEKVRNFFFAGAWWR
jgi:hypothetical protein